MDLLKQQVQMRHTNLREHEEPSSSSEEEEESEESI